MNWESIIKYRTFEEGLGSKAWITAVKKELNAEHTGWGVFEFDYKGKQHHFNMHYLTKPPEVSVNGFGKASLVDDPIRMARIIRLIIDKQIDYQSKIGE